MYILYHIEAITFSIHIVHCTPIHRLLCGICWFLAAIIFYIITAALVFSFHEDWRGIGKIGAIIGLIPAIGGVYLAFIGCPRCYLLCVGLITLWSAAFSIVGAILILIGERTCTCI